MYDKRPAKTLQRAKKPTPGRRLSTRDWATIKRLAETISADFPNAKLVSYHKRRKRAVWIAGQRRITLYG